MGEIDDYLAGIEEQQRRALVRVRDIAQRVARDGNQGTSYGMPALRVAGKPLLGFNVTRQHVSLHPFSPAVVAAVPTTWRASPCRRHHPVHARHPGARGGH